ncbi:MAG TPA: hypothetical protein VE890_00485, partial [Thermoguttaceae bacterium]|nr:hypothetical protein [Thermoguttaceae bacterium]
MFDFGASHFVPSSVDLGLPGEDSPEAVDIVETSSSPTDLAILGDGFFIVEGDGTADGGVERLHTRGGSFRLDAEGQLVTEAGNLVLGYGIDDE